MNSLLCAIPYCPKDSATAERLLNWIEELDSGQSVFFINGHSALLAADSAVPRETMQKIHSLAKKSFRHVETIVITVPTGKQTWGSATKIMFENVASQVSQCYKLPWLWLEPDCVPLVPGWIEFLCDEYRMCPKRFMGAIVTQEQMRQGTPHMAGPGIYPHDCYQQLTPYLSSGEHFDLAIAPHVLPRAIDTPLIHHFWGTPELAPTFKPVKEPGDAQNVMTPDQIRRKAVLWHRNKDGTLIEILRERRKRKADSEVHEAKPPPVRKQSTQSPPQAIPALASP